MDETRSNLKDRARSLLDRARGSVRAWRQGDREAARQALGEVRTELSGGVDSAADAIARRASKWTGRDVTPSEIKKAAAVAGIAALVLGAARRLGPGGAPSSGDAGDDPVVARDGFDSSFEGQAYGFFADKGGLNIETTVVDQDDCPL